MVSKKTQVPAVDSGFKTRGGFYCHVGLSTGGREAQDQTLVELVGSSHYQNFGGDKKCIVRSPGSSVQVTLLGVLFYVTFLRGENVTSIWGPSKGSLGRSGQLDFKYALICFLSKRTNIWRMKGARFFFS